MNLCFQEEMMSEGGDHDSWGDDELMIAENNENPVPGVSEHYSFLSKK